LHYFRWGSAGRSLATGAQIISQRTGSTAFYVAAFRNWKSEIAAAAHKKKVSLANWLTKVQLIADYLDNQLPMHRYVHGYMAR